MVEEVDVLVVGSGPAGLSAAHAAAELGASVDVIDENPDAGGQIWRSDAGKLPDAASRWKTRCQDAGVRFHQGVAVFHAPSHRRLLVEGPDGPRALAFRRLVLAAGARELFLPFPGWTLPGVFGVGAVQALVRGGFDVSGRRVFVAGSGPLLLAVAVMLKDRGAIVVGVAEQAPRRRVAAFAMSLWREPRRLAQAISLRRRLGRVPYWTGAWPVEAQGRGRVETVLVRHGTRSRTLACDVLAAGFGLVPNLELALLLGCNASDHGVAVNSRQETSLEGIFAAGELAGVAGLPHALVSGRAAGISAGGRLVPRRLEQAVLRERVFGARVREAFALRAELRGLARAETIVCRCEDVSWSEVREYAESRQAKLITRCGMGPCQARVCGPALRHLLGWSWDRVRPPLFPVPMSALGPLDGSDEGVGSR